MQVYVDAVEERQPVNRTLVALAMLAVAAVSAFAQTANLPKMDVDFSFEQKHKCQGVSPEIRLGNVPAGVVSYDVKLTDLDVPSFQHWSQAIRATGPVIPGGAGVGYFGPCPPSGTHRYEIVVTARDAQKKPVAYGEKMVVTGR